ncbi:NAD(P)H-dependent oxidoreductase [Micromonospora sp. M12]
MGGGGDDTVADRRDHRQHPEGRAGDRVAHWFVEQANRHDDLAVTVVDLTGYDFPATYPAEPTASIRAFVREVGRADGFVVVTPEYNHSFPASLKQAIDYAYDEWQAKPVGFVSYGCRSTGLHAVDQLRTVFTALHAMTVRDVVGIDLLAGEPTHSARKSCAVTRASCSTSSAGGGWPCATVGRPALRLLKHVHHEGKDHE